MNDTAALQEWLSNQSLETALPIDVLRDNGILSLEDLAWIALNPSYHEEFAGLVKPVGLRARISRLLAVHPSALRLAQTSHQHSGTAQQWSVCPQPLGGALPLIAAPPTSQPQPEVQYPLSGQHVLQVFWDIENVVSVKEEVPDFINRVSRKLIDENVIESRANMKIHVVAKTEILTRFANQLRGTSNHLVQSEKKEATDREIEGLVRDMLSMTTPAHVPAIMLITSDCDFLGLMSEVRRSGRNLYIVHKAQEKHPQHEERLRTFANLCWAWRDIFAAGCGAKSAAPLNRQLALRGPTQGTIDASSAALDPSAVYAAPPKTAQEVKARLANYPHLLLVCEALKFGREHPEEMNEQYNKWMEHNIKFPDETYTAFYLYRDGHKRGFCTKFNGIGDGRAGYCNTKDKYDSICGFLHICLFCEKQGHGWYSDCPAYAEYENELQSIGVVDERDFDVYVDLYCGTAQAAITTDNTELMQQEETRTAVEFASASANLLEEGNAKGQLTAAEITKGPAKSLRAPFDQNRVLHGVFYRDDLADMLKDSPMVKSYLWTVGGAFGSKEKMAQAQKWLTQWKENRVPLTSDHFAAFYVSKGENYCCRLNGPGPASGVGYGACNYQARTGTPCVFVHKCLLCDGEGHGWFDFNICPARAMMTRELRELELSRQDFGLMLAIYAKPGRKATFSQPAPPPATPTKTKTVVHTAKGATIPLPATVPAREPLPTTPKEIWSLLNDHQELYNYVRCMTYSTDEQIAATVQMLKYNGFYVGVSTDFAAYYRRHFNLVKKNPEILDKDNHSLCVNFNVAECRYKQLKGSPCPRAHRCALCDDTKHGYSYCPQHDVMAEQLERLRLTDEDINAFVKLIREHKAMQW